MIYNYLFMLFLFSVDHRKKITVSEEQASSVPEQVVHC